MISEDTIRSYLDRAQGDLVKARKIAMDEHNPIHQTLTAKFSALEKMKQEDVKL